MHPVAAFEALGHDTRLAVFRLLIPAGPDGLAAGEISERIGMPPNALSFHLSRLVQADLVTSRRAGRQIFYAVEYERLSGLLSFLLNDCCADAPSGCLPGCPTKPLDAGLEVNTKPSRPGSKAQRR